MRAVVYDPDAPTNLAFGEVPEPEPGADEVVVDVKAIALNFGEIHWVENSHRPGDVLGWDSAGIVVKEAADGSGPPAGSPVVSFNWAGGWAERRTAATSSIAVIPESVDFADAVGLPVAGVTALQALRALGPVVGRRVLITGASGGVGRFAVQLAARAGAHVIAAVGSAARGAGLPELGAAEVVVGLDDVSELVFGVLDNVGGPRSPKRSAWWARAGRCSRSAWHPDEPTTIDFEAERHALGPEAFGAVQPSRPVPARPGASPRMLANGELDPQIGLRDSWDNVASAAQALLDRRVAGKAVLFVD